MNSKTFGQLVQEFYDRFDAGQSKYISREEAGRLVNEAAAHLHNWLATQNPLYLYQEAQLPVNSADMSCGLPESFNRAVKVWANGTELEPLSIAQYGDGVTRGYFHRQHRIYLQGLNPMGSGYPAEICVGYLPAFVPMKNDPDTVSTWVAPGYDSYIINLAVINAKVKEEAPIADLVALNGKIEELILQDVIARKAEERNQVLCKDPMYRWGYWGEVF